MDKNITIQAPGVSSKLCIKGILGQSKERIISLYQYYILLKIISQKMKLIN